MLPRFKSPAAIQNYLDALPYNSTDQTLSPYGVVRKQMAHCFDGAVFAATALQQLGHRPLLVDLRAMNDDDHVLAVFKENGLWGAVAKSNTTLLRFRHPVFRTIRELALSYFTFYFNTDAEMTLFEYSRPFSLRRYGDSYLDVDDIEFIAPDLDAIKHYRIIDKPGLKRLPPPPQYLVDACFLGADWEGFYKKPG